MYYILDENNNPVLEPDFDKYCEFMRDENRKRVALTEIEKGAVSTVFLGLDHSFGDTPYPILFETMCFFEFEAEEEYQTRYATWREAERGHQNIVNMLKGKGNRNGLDLDKFL